MFGRSYQPHQMLVGIVKGYHVVHAYTPAEIPQVILPFPPHAVQQFVVYLRDPTERFHYRTGQSDTQPSCIVVGPQVSRVDITIGRDMLIVAAFFEPGGLHRLLGIPMYELFDESLDVSLIWNKEIRELELRLRETCDYDYMQQILEAFLLVQLKKTKIETHPIDTTLRLLQDTTKALSLDYLADQACLSPRQFERKCRERLGFGPTTFRRIVRFSRAYRLKEQRPDLSWLDVAFICGYYDIQHMRRDFKDFGASTPSLLLQEETRTNLRGYTSHEF